MIILGCQYEKTTMENGLIIETLIEGEEPTAEQGQGPAGAALPAPPDRTGPAAAGGLGRP